MKPQLSTRQTEVAGYVARGVPTKQIAATLHISVRTVEEHIREAASRIPGPATPRHRLTLFFLDVDFTE